jgi:crossover junction endodeoxyribonuclease RusA
VTIHRLDLPYRLPPLSLNDRRHWRTKARITANLRSLAAAWCEAAIQPCERVAVELHYVPVDKRRRDADNLVPILKALCDGLVDAGLVDDDTPDFMDKGMPVIDLPDRDRTRESRLYLTVEVLA